ncbi:MAG TPA: DNA mismatch repair endonuclease MutH [Gammaproteobacteria bacterium]
MLKAMPPPETMTPLTEAELMERASALAGKTLGKVALQTGLTMPASMKQAKGLVGQLIELALAGTCSTHAGPDFPALGIELKTLPLDRPGHPRESTYVCTVAPQSDLKSSWKQSRVWHKLARVLWIPVEAAPEIPLAQRRIGSPVFWHPDAAQDKILQQDWDELTGMIREGELDKLTSRYGQYLQIRPKARDSKALQSSSGPDGSPGQTLPRGYYLRTCLTRQILDSHT